MLQKWSTVEEVAPALGMSKQGVYDAIRKGQLPSETVLRIGKRIRINLEILNDLPRARATESEDEKDAA